MPSPIQSDRSSSPQDPRGMSDDLVVRANLEGSNLVSQNARDVNRPSSPATIRGGTSPISSETQNARDVKPYDSVLPCTIAPWLVDVLKGTGIYSFQSHSTRAATTANPWYKGSSVQDILKQLIGLPKRPLESLL